MDIPEKIINKILSGELREQYGLDTSTGSDYYNERMKGTSDVEAQYIAFKKMRIKENVR